MKPMDLSVARVRQILDHPRQRILVIGDVMLDHFVWGTVSRISPEAPVPVVDFSRENFMPGGAANVARNLKALEVATEIFGAVGADEAAKQVASILADHDIGCAGLLRCAGRITTLKTRIVAHTQQVVRIDRESRNPLEARITRRLLSQIEERLDDAAAVIIGDYGKGVVTQELLEGVKLACRARGIWLSLDPKPVHHLNLTGLSLITPNRKEAFELAALNDDTRRANPLEDRKLMLVSERLLNELRPALLLITLGEQGMLLCRRDQRPYHIPTIAQEVFDVSGAGDTVIASFTAAIAAGAAPIEAALISNYAAGIVVGKVGTATVTREELVARFQS